MYLEMRVFLAYAGIRVEGGLKFPKSCSTSDFGSALVPDFDQRVKGGSPDSGCCLAENSMSHKATSSTDSGFIEGEDPAKESSDDERVSQLVQQLKDGAHDVDQSLRNRPLKHSPSQPNFSTFHHSSTPVTSAPLFAKIKEEETEPSPMSLFHHMPLAKNPYMSPLLASDKQLEDLCPVYLVVCTQLEGLLITTDCLSFF